MAERVDLRQTGFCMLMLVVVFLSCWWLSRDAAAERGTPFWLLGRFEPVRPHLTELSEARFWTDLSGDPRTHAFFDLQYAVAPTVVRWVHEDAEVLRELEAGRSIIGYMAAPGSMQERAVKLVQKMAGGGLEPKIIPVGPQLFLLGAKR